MQSILPIIALCLSLACMAIYACDTEQEIVTRYCKSEVVFKGVPVSGSSSLAADENGATQTLQRMTFQVSEYYQTNNNHNTNTEEVTRTYTENDGCGEAFVPDSDGPYLVMASGGLFLNVPPCGYVVPMECAPADLSNVKCSY